LQANGGSARRGRSLLTDTRQSDSNQAEGSAFA